MPIFVRRGDGNEAIWAAGQRVTEDVWASWEALDCRLFVAEDRLSALALFAENQLQRTTRNEPIHVHRFRLVLAARLALLCQSPELPGVLTGLAQLASLQGAFDLQMLDGLINPNAVKFMRPSIRRQFQMAALVSVIARDAPIRSSEDLIYAAYLCDVGKLAKVPVAGHEASYSGQVAMSILARHYPVALETHQAILGYQERLDGSGMPYGVGGLSIPMAARCLGLAKFLVDQSNEPMMALRDFTQVLARYPDTLRRAFDQTLVGQLSLRLGALQSTSTTSKS